MISIFTRIRNENKILAELSKNDAELKEKNFYIIFKREKNSILEQ